jgi:hypothetical protein
MEAIETGQQRSSVVALINNMPRRRRYLHIVSGKTVSLIVEGWRAIFMPKELSEENTIASYRGTGLYKERVNTLTDRQVAVASEGT